MALVANGPNPSAGKQFLDYMISKDAQSSVAAIGRRPVRIDVESVKELTPLNQIKTIEYDLLWAVENKKQLVGRWSDTLLDVQENFLRVFFLSQVTVEAAVKKYGGFQALNQVSLDIPSGAFFTCSVQADVAKLHSCAWRISMILTLEI